MSILIDDKWRVRHGGELLDQRKDSAIVDPKKTIQVYSGRFKMSVLISLTFEPLFPLSLGFYTGGWDMRPSHLWPSQMASSAIGQRALVGHRVFLAKDFKSTSYNRVKEL